MKKLSIDDLMAEIWAAGRNCDREKYDNATDELSSRFKEIENLHCCGNCINHRVLNIDTYCEVTGEQINGHKAYPTRRSRWSNKD